LAADLLGAEGPLARQIPGFAPRIQQQQLTAAVAATLDDDTLLVAEAGTGIGKTFAYLVPALLADKKVIISTGTRNLQDQLYHKDLPLVREALGRPLRAALLKGRANYLCRYRLQQARAGGRADRTGAVQLERIADWSRRTRSGDIAEVTDVPEDSPLWPRVTSTVDNCLGQQCPLLDECHVLQARRRALEADLVVVNHHLLCADLALKDEGFGEILPGADAFVIDEAHQLPDIAGQFFGLSLSSGQIQDLGRDGRTEQAREAPEFTDLGERCRELEQAAALLHRALGEPRRAAWPEVLAAPVVAEALERLAATLARLAEALAEGARRGPGLAHGLERCRQLQTRLQAFAEPAAADCVYWFDQRTRSLTLHATPLDVSTAFRQRLERYRCAWVFTSATLAVGEDFGHFTRRLGLDGAATLRLESPFDYARNALLYHPRGLPEPADVGYTGAVLEAALPVLAASGGRAFILFTSHQALRTAAGELESRLSYPLLVQGTLPKGALLERFRRLGNAVLLGTASFWEGVDVRGEALSCVIITKLPFAAPGDPLTQARSEALRRQGGNPFTDYQLPQAVIALKQGVGRLIRDVDDRGVLMLADPRLLSRGYGRVFLDSLPPMARTRSLDRVRRFFAAAPTGMPA
ncbi:MAG: ATP-dependent DNA helicase, partial [Candidatus Competibacterales bacterium]|nr:ATP-dependent DNA helicase [Candidatus Competibacterales bacterium]